MKQFYKVFLILMITGSLLFTACQTQGEFSETENPVVTNGNSQKPGDVTSTVPSQESVNTPSPVPSPDTTTEPDSLTGIEKVVLTNGANSTGNTSFNSAHYGLHITYTGEYVTFINYTTLMQHGADLEKEPIVFQGFEYQGEDVQAYRDKLYFLMYDYEKGEYYLYSYDYENPPVKVTESTVYHYEFAGDTIYYTKEFVQGPIYSMNTDGSGEMQLTQMRAHSFVIEEGSIYFYATDAGTAPGLVKYDIATKEESILVFPFYSHNYLVSGGYAYYVNEGTYRSIHRVNLSNQTVEDLWMEIPDYTISMNMSDGILYIHTDYAIYKCNPDGSNRTLLYESAEYLKTGMYIFGDRIYVTDEYDIIVVNKNDGTVYSYPLN